MSAMDVMLFDLDGTLLDTATDLHRALVRLLTEHDRPPIALEQTRRHVSRGARGLVRLAFGDVPNEAMLTSRLVDLYQQDIAAHSRVFDGMVEVLDALRSGGRRWGIVTNKLEALARRVVQECADAEQLTDASLLIGGDTAGERKPHPAPLLLAADQLDAPVDRIVYVGDAPTDIAAGQRAGMQTVAVGWGYVPEDEASYEHWPADHHAATPRDLLSLLDRL